MSDTIKTMPATKLLMPVAIKKTVEPVNQKLSDDQQRQLGHGIATLMVQVEHLKTLLAESVKTQRDHINGLKATLRDHAKTLSNGYTSSLEEVELQFDFNTETVRTMFQGKPIKERPMTPEEKQLDLSMCLEQGMDLKPVLTNPKAKAS